MPAFVAGFTAFFTGATVVGVVGTIGYLAAVAVFNATLGAIARKLTSKKESDVGRRQEREVTVRATDAYDVFVYGRALVGGVTVYHNGIPDANGINNRMHHVVKWAGHACTSISLFRLDDRKIDPVNANVDWDASAYTGTGLVQAGQFRGTATTSGPTYLRWYLGDQSSADARLNSQATEWTNSHVGHDQTYGVLEIWQVDAGEQTSKVFQKGFPNNVAAVLHGKKIYDHRRYALNGDPEFRNLSSYWFAANAITTVSGDLAASSDNWSAVQGIGGKNDSGVANSSAVLRRVYSDLIAVDPTSTYGLTLDVRDLNASSRALRANVLGFTAAGVGIAAQTWVNTRVPRAWTRFTGTVASGGTVTLSDSARFIRIGLEVSSGTGGTLHLQAQDHAVYLGTASRHLVGVSSTWQYSESPPFCVADYLKDERLGFGKRIRIPINPSRYARNGDPTWRRQGTLDNGIWWRTLPESGDTTALGPTASISLAQTGAPVGRRALVVAGSAGTAAGGHSFFSDAIPIDPSGQYFVSVQARQDGAKAAFLGVAFLDGNGVNINGVNSSDATGWLGGQYHYFHSNQPLASVWSNHVIAIGSGATASIPSCASFIALGALCVRSAGANGDTQQYFQDYRLMVGTEDRHFIEPHEQIYWPSVSSAAAYTDALVATPSGTQVRFSCNGAGHTGIGHRENVRDLLSSFNGRCIYVQSGFWITAGWEEPGKTLGKSDFRSGGSIKVRAQAELADRFNTVRGVFYDPVNEYKSVPMANVTANEYIARDSSQQLFHDVELPFTNDWFMAQRVGFGILEQGDNQQLVEFQLKHSALDLMPGRVVGINHDVLSWSNHTLRMVDMRTDLKKGVTLYGKEDYQASYIDPSTSEYFSRTFTGVTSAAPIVPQVSSVTATPRDSGVQLNWVNPAARSFEWIDVYRRTTNAFSGSTLVKSTRNDEYFDPTAGTTHFYWFRSRDFANNVSSVYPGLVSSFSGAGLGNALINPGFEAGDSGWTVVNGGWTIVEDAVNARFGSWVAQVTDGVSGASLVNNSRLQVAEGDRVLAQAFFDRTAGVAGTLRVVIVWLDDTDSTISQSNGNGITLEPYGISRVVAVAPATAVTAQMRFQVNGGTGDTDGFGDGAYMAIIPRDADIGILDTTGVITDPQVTDEPVDGNIVYTSGTQPRAENAGLNGNVQYTAPSDRSAQVTVSWTGQAQISNTTSGVAVGEARLVLTVQVNSVTVFTRWLVLESFTGTTDWAVFSGTRTFTVPAGQLIDVDLTVGRNFSTGGASPAQTITWRDSWLNLEATKK